MPNALLDRLTATYTGALADYDRIMNACGDAGRDPTAAECRQLDDLRGDLDGLSERITQLREDQTRRDLTIAALTGRDDDLALAGGPDQPPAGAPSRRRPPPLDLGETQLRSMLSAITQRTPWSEAIQPGLPMHARAAITSPGTVPFWSYPPIESGVEARLADRVATRPADGGNVVEYLAVTAPAVLQNVAEATPKPDSGLVISRRTATLQKPAAYSDISWEMQADFESVEAIVNLELTSALVRFENAMLVTAINADPGILKPTPAATSPLISIWQAKQAVRAAPNVGTPDLCIIHPTDWAIVAAELASTSGLLLGGEQAVQLGPAETVWGMQVFQTVSQTPTKVTLGVAVAAAFFLREGPRAVVDPFSQATSNLTRVILEERAAAGVLNPGRWATYTLPGGALASSEGHKK